MRLALLAMTILALSMGSLPVYAYSQKSTSPNLVSAEAPAKININDVMQNVRAGTSVRIKELVRLTDPDNPSGFNYDGIFIFGIPAVKITEKIGFGDDTEGLDIGYSTYIGTVDNEWYGIEKDIAIVGKSGDERKAATRIFNLAGVFPFETFPPGNTAKLNKADQTVDNVKCDEYTWKKGKNEYSMCVMRDLAVPVLLTATLDTVKAEVHYSNYNDPDNVFDLPREKSKDFFAADAFMALHTLKNFQYETVYATKTAKGTQIDSTVRGQFVQDEAAFEASEWVKTDDTSTAPANRYVQIVRSRWTAPGDDSKPFKAAPALNPRGVIRFSDKFTRATPFLIWMSMVSDAKFKGAAKVVDDKADVGGEAAIKYKIGENDKKPDDFVEMVVMKETGVPVSVEYHFTEGGKKNVVTWKLIAMDESGRTIQTPTTTK